MVSQIPDGMHQPRNSDASCATSYEQEQERHLHTLRGEMCAMA
jgi:hypothetical protein